jgi:hypothetical protein
LEARGGDKGMPIATMASSHDKLVIAPDILFPHEFDYLPARGSWGSCSINATPESERIAWSVLAQTCRHLVDKGFDCQLVTFNLSEKGYASGWPVPFERVKLTRDDDDDYDNDNDNNDFCLMIHCR